MSQQDQVAAINAALAQAKAAAAAAAPAAPAQLPAVANQNAAPAVVQPGPRVNMRQMVAEAGMRPDAYLKVDKAGFLVGKDTKSFLEEIEVEFRLTNAVAFYGLRFGNPAKYLRSYDRLVEVKSRKSWEACITQAAQQDSRCTGDYAAVDLLMTATADIKGKGDALLLEKGKTLGWTSSITAWGNWVAFVQPIYDLIDAGIIPNDVMIRGKIKHEQREGNGNLWGVVNFSDLHVADLGAPAEEVDQAA